MSSGLRLREIGPDDVDAASAVLGTNLAFLALQGDVEPSAVELPDGFVARLVEDETAAGGRALLVRDGAEPVAVATTLLHPREHVPWIGLLVVHASRQGRGIGERVERMLAEGFRADGHTVSRLGVLETNPAALRFWTRIGYRATDRRTSTTGHPVIVCERRLDTTT